MAESVKPVEGVAYSANAFDDIFVALLAAVGYDPTTMAPFRYNPWGRNTLAVTGAASPVAVASGDALVNGKHYTNTASKDINVASPAAATRIDRVVLRLDYTASPMTCEAVLLSGVEGGAAPALTQTDGTKWEVSLAQLSVTTAGVITVTDERVMVGDSGTTVYALAANALAATALGRAKMQNNYFDEATALAKFGTDSVTNAVLLKAIKDGAFQADAATRALFADGIWTAAQIADRTRTLFVPCIGQTVSGSSAPRTVDNGWLMADTVSTYAFGEFYIPSDYASGMTVVAVIHAPSAGNAYLTHTAYYAAPGEAYNAASTVSAASAVAFLANKLTAVKPLTLSGITAGDYVTLKLLREGGHASDTVNDTVYLKGWLISYTADM